MGRTLMLVAVVAAVAPATGCIVPRSAGYGFTGAALGPGGADVGLAMGLVYQQEANAPQTSGTGTTTTTNRQVQLPSFEAHAALGITDQVAVNLHASQAGLQPGVVITVLKEPVQVSLVPELGGGFVTQGASTTTIIGGSSTTAEGNGASSFTILGGARALVVLPQGLYGGLGYDFQYVSQGSRNAVSGVTTTTTSQAHNVGAAVGYELTLGSIVLRPELAVLFTPLAKNQTNASGTTADLPDSTGLYLFPNVTVAAAAKGK